MLAFLIGFRYAFNRSGAVGINFLVNVAVCSLALGVGLLVLVLSVMNGFEHELKHRILSVAPHVQIHAAKPISEQEFSAISQSLSTSEYIEVVEPIISKKALLVRKNNTKAVNISGLMPDGYLLNKMAQFHLEGDQTTLAKNSIAISKVIADELSIELGDKLKILITQEGFRSRKSQVKVLEVSRIFATKTELDNGLAFVSMSTARELSGQTEGYSRVAVFTNDVMRAKQIASEIYRSLQSQFWVSDWTQSQGNLYQAIQTSRQMVLLMLTVIIAVAAMNIITAMTMVVSHKTKEFAMLLAMGLPQLGLMRVVLVQANLIAFIGIGVGVLVGVVLSLFIGDVVSTVEQVFGYQFLKSDIYPVTYMPSKIAIADIFTVVVPAFMIALLAAIYPAYQAAKLAPAAALRYDK